MARENDRPRPERTPHDDPSRAAQARQKALADLDRDASARTACPHCDAAALRPWGRTARGLRRWRCHGCGRTSSATTGTPLYRLRAPELVQETLRDMMSAAPSSCRALGERLGVRTSTVWRWRIRLITDLASRPPGCFDGILAAGRGLIRESRKASREWVRHRSFPDRFPKPPRPRWIDWRRSGRPMPTGSSRWMMPLLLAVDRAGRACVERLSDHGAATFSAALVRRLDLGQMEPLPNARAARAEPEASRRHVPSALTASSARRWLASWNHFAARRRDISPATSRGSAHGAASIAWDTSHEVAISRPDAEACRS